MTSLKYYKDTAWVTPVKNYRTGGAWVTPVKNYFSGKTWWVRPAGTTYGQNNGTSYDNAVSGNDGLASLSGSISAGDIIALCGTHYETIEIPVSGNAEKPVYIRGNFIDSDPGIIDGSILIDPNDWELYSGNIYRAPIKSSNVDYIQDSEPASPADGEIWFNTGKLVDLGASGIPRKWDNANSEWIDCDGFIRPNQVFLDGNAAGCSRFPASGFATASANTQTSLTNPSLGNYVLDGARVVSQNVNWQWEERIITGQSTNTVTFTDTIYTTFPTHKFYIEDAVDLIANAGEWAYRDGYLYMFFSDAPSNHAVRYSSHAFGVFADSKDYLDIKDLAVRKTNDSGVFLRKVHNANVSQIVLDDIYCHQFWRRSRAAISAFAVTPIEYKADSDQYLVIADSSIEISDCTITNVTGGEGIIALGYASGSVVDNSLYNISSDILRNRSWINGISVASCNDVVVNRNYLNNVQWAGINLGRGVMGCSAEYNIVETCCLFQTDCDAFRLQGKSATCRNNVIRYNTVKDVRYSATYGDGNVYCYRIDLPDGPEYNTVESNIAYRTQGEHVLLCKGQNNTMRYNDIYEDDPVTIVYRFDDFPNNTVADNTQYAETAYTE